MKRYGILNSHISKILTDLGHTDYIVISDKGLPIPEGVKIIPDIQAVFAHNDEMAIGVIEPINSSSKDILVIGFDGNDDTLKAIKAGKMDATVAQ
ncbi:hypothetical protein BIV60_14710 [Bacillus sp. MUM 116]|nr:hypothetical protein BIV60_14710 [Bacillus sp. MUM 116]